VKFLRLRWISRGENANTSVLSPETQTESAGEDATLLTLYALAGEECGRFVTLHPRILTRIRRHILAISQVVAARPSFGDVAVRELPVHEMRRAEEELWIHDQHQKTDMATDRLFAAFSGTQLIGVARCSRHPDGCEVDGVYVLEEYRHRGFAKRVMQQLIEECGRNETLYLHARPDLVDFYRKMGFVIVQLPDLPASIRSATTRPGSGTVPMKRDPARVPGGGHE